MARRAATASSNSVDLARWKKTGVVAGVIGSILATLVAFSTVVHLVFQAGVAPINQAIQDEAQQRAASDSLIGLQVGTVARMVVTPDSTARAILLERVQELSPSGGK